MTSLPDANWMDDTDWAGESYTYVHPDQDYEATVAETDNHEGWYWEIQRQGETVEEGESTTAEEAFSTVRSKLPPVSTEARIAAEFAREDPGADAQSPEGGFAGPKPPESVTDDMFGSHEVQMSMEITGDAMVFATWQVFSAPDWTAAYENGKLAFWEPTSDDGVGSYINVLKRAVEAHGEEAKSL